MKLFTVPNLLTLGNLLCGCLAIVFAFQGDLVWSAYLVGIAAVLDFLDGFMARLLKQHSPIGKELDSLADMVTFGVVPGVVMFQLIQAAIIYSAGVSLHFSSVSDFTDALHTNNRFALLSFVAFIIPLFSALRLAKFNIDTRQTESFIGLPTPANSIFFCSLPLVLIQCARGSTALSGWNVYPPSSTHPALVSLGKTGLWLDSGSDFEIAIQHILLNPWILLSITIIFSVLLIVELPLFSLKFKSFGWKGNAIRYIFLLLSIVMLVALKYVALPLIIVLYILMSVGNNLVKKGNSKSTNSKSQNLP